MREFIINETSVEKALEEVQSKYRLNPEYLACEVLDSETVKVYVKKDLDEILYDYFSKFFEESYTSYKIDLLKGENSLKLLIDSSDNPIFIGREGCVLKAFQHLTRQIANLYAEEKLNVTVDIGGYNDNRNHHLEALAVKTAKEVIRTKIPVTLKNLNSFERRIIHAKLSERNNIKTESAGEGKDRCLVISYKEDKE